MAKKNDYQETYLQVVWKKGSRIHLAVQRLHPDCSFDGVEMRTGTVYHCKFNNVENDTYNKLAMSMRKSDGIKFEIVSQDENVFTMLEVKM